MCIKLMIKLQLTLEKCQVLDFLVPLAMRLYLAPVFWMAGMEKWHHFANTVEWFGNTEWGLGLPFPMVMAFLATVTEIVGAICLIVGFATRWISIPLMATMLVAALSVHWDNGWSAIANEQHEAVERLQGFLTWLESHFPSKHQHITELGRPVILNNGIEFAVTYFIMLLSLLFTGGGRWCSLDCWFRRKFLK